VPPAPEREATEPPALSLVVPTFNEANRLTQGLDRLRGAAAEGAVDLATTELLLVDDGSSDDTRRTAARLADRFPLARVVTFPRNQGKGSAVRAGILAASGEKVAFADADMAIDPSLLPSLLDALDRVPVAVGSRAVHGRVDYGTRVRTDAGRAFNLAVRTVGGVRLADTQCGFKGFRRGPALLLALLQTVQGYAFDVELLWLAGRLGLEVEVVPVTWLDVPGSTVHVVRDSSRMLLDLVAARRRPRYVAALEVDGTLPAVVPPATVVVRADNGTMLCGAVGALGDLRSVAGPGAVTRLCSLDELVDRVPLELEPPR
jgi:glycosyltransferase involved in cell wall biosynthesis